jgi:uncharacterized protein involved in exopolysaccharide biosynthesis
MTNPQDTDVCSPPPGSLKAARTDRDQDEVSIIALLNALLLDRRLIVVAGFTGLVFFVAAGSLGGRQYASTAMFMPESRNVSSSLSGLAGQLGIALPVGDPGNSQQFYVDLVQSKPILREVVDASYTVRDGGRQRMATLTELYGGRDSNPAFRRDAAIKKLNDHTESRSRSTGVIELKVTADDPALAQQLSSRMLEAVNRFNVDRRQTRAAAERKFAQQRLAEVRVELQRSEDALQSFLQRNRQYESAPGLTFAHERLARDVSNSQQLYTTLLQAYEQAKLDEVRDIPVITIIASPEVAIRPEPRGLLKKGLIGLILGLSAGVLLAFVRQFFRSLSGTASDEQVEFSVLKHAMLDDLRHPWRLLLLRRGAPEADRPVSTA